MENRYNGNLISIDSKKKEGMDSYCIESFFKRTSRIFYVRMRQLIICNLRKEKKS